MDEYLNSQIIATAEKKKKTALIAGGILTAFFIYSIIAAATGTVTVEGSSQAEGVLIFTVCLIPSALWLISGLLKLRNIELARRYSTIFSCDEDGFVSADELARQTGKPLTQVFKELDVLLKKGFLRNCSLQKTGSRVGVKLAGARMPDSAAQGGFVVVRCECCGGTSSIRAGTSGKCEYCGSAIRA